MSSNMLRIVGSHGASIQQGELESEGWIDLWDVLPEIWTELGKLVQEQEIHKSPDISRMIESVQPQSSSGFSKM